MLKSKSIAINGKRVDVKPLTVPQVVLILRVLKPTYIKTCVPAGKSNPDTMLNWFAAVGDSLPELVGAILGEPADLWRDVSIEDVSELALALCEVNNFDKMLANLQEAARQVELKTESLTPKTGGILMRLWFRIKGGK